MELLADLSRSLEALVETGGASVVRVEARRSLAASGVIWASDGLIVAADHAVEREEGVRVGLPDGAAVPAVVVGRDPSTDVALLRAEATGLASPRWGDAASARAGRLVLGLGRPGRTIRATLAVVSAAADRWETPGGGVLDRYVEIDGRPHPGFSGSLLVDASGGALGMTTSGLLRRAMLAVPASTLGRVAEALLAHGRIRRGYLGVGAQPVRLPPAARQAYGQDAGLLVLSVEPGSPADQAGVMLGDVVLGLGSDRVHDVHDLLRALQAERIGTRMPLRILRAGAARELAVVIGERG
ncbi:MAG: S1C family serine protease [Armatimonadota bacterium]|nr:S1C family serine protease [Armatimonadota bacterium]